MADYYVDLQGNVTRNKKKKKKADYSVSLDGIVTKNFQEQETTIPNTDVVPVKTKTTVEMPSRLNGPRGMESSYAALEEVTRKQVEKTAKEKNLQSTQFDGLTNATYKEYLDNLENNAKDGKQTEWLQTQKENLSIMQDDRVRSYLSTMLPFYLNAENKAAHKPYNEAKAKMKKLGYTDKQIDSLLDTYDRETNAKHNESMSKKADKLTEQGIGGKVAAQVLGIGAGVESAFAGLEGIGATVNEKVFDIYNPLDTNSQAFTAGDFKQRVSGNIQKDIEGETPNVVRKGLGVLYQGATGAADSLATAMTFGPAAPIVMAAQAVGNSVKDTFRRTGSNEKATATGLASGAIEYGTEKMGLDNLWDIMKGSGKAATRSALVNILGQAGIEGAEEATSEALGTIADFIINNADSNLKQNAQKYKNDGKSDKEAWTAAVLDALKEVGHAGLIGTVSGGISGSAASAIGMDAFSKNEKKVIDKEVENRISEREKDGVKLKLKEKAEIRKEVEQALKDGDISIDTIESALGGQTFEDLKSYNDQKKALEDEIENFRKMPMSEFTVADSERLRDARKELVDLKKGTDEKQLKERLSQEVSDMTLSDSYIRESYNEKGRRSQAFEADLSKYNAKQQATIQKAIDSKILNNTNKTHKFVDLLAKISADKGVSFDFTDNARIKESGFAVQGATVNGYVKDGNVTLNINSAKVLNSVVGHEITHVLEGTEHYAALQEAVFEYAKTKKDYDGRLKTLTELYKNVENADVNKELTADLVGDYLFTDEKFVRQLSAQNRNVFQKIYDEIKYLVKTVTSGSKEAKQMEKVKKLFDEVYKESTKTISKDTQYSIAELPDGGKYVNVDTNQDLFVGLDESQSRRKAKDIILERFAGAVIGEKESQPVVATKRTAKEYAYARKRNTTGEKAIDKMKASTELDNLLEASQFVEHADYEDIKERHPEAVGGIDTYKTIFKVSEQWYEGIVNVLNCANVRVLYDVTKIKNIGGNELPVSNNSPAAKANAPINIIPQNQGNTTAKQKFSISKENINKVTDEGLTMTYVRVPNQNTQNYGSTYGQNIEPAGEYMSMDTSQGKYKIEGYEYGTIQFKKPLVLEHINTGETGWKKTVSEMYNGLTGKKLTKALMKDGYDAIVTHDEDGYNEIVNLDGTKLGERQFSLNKQNEDVAPIGNWNVKGKDLALEGATKRQDITPAQQQDVTVEDIAPWTGEDDLNEGMFSSPEETAEKETDQQEDAISKKNAERIKNIQANIKGLQMSRDIVEKDFNASINEKTSEYENLQRKDTKKAAQLLTQIENLKYRKDNALAEVDKKIKQQKKAIKNIKNGEIARRRKTKQQQYRNLMSGLIGDTSTWKDKKLGVSYQTNTLRRNLRDIVRDADGKRDTAKADAIYEELQGKYNQHEAELHREANRIKQVFKDMNINKAENVYIQMLGEYRHNPDSTITPDVIQEFYEKNKDKIDNAKVDKAIDEARRAYDNLFYRVNDVLKEHGFRELGYKEGYFPHFTEDKQHWLAKLLNWKTQNNEIPTDIAGLTEQFNPERSWQSFDKHRTGDKTDYNFMKGLDTYVQGSLDWIYHIEDIQKRRALENEIRYQHSDKGVQEKLEEIYNSNEYDTDQMQEQIDLVLKTARNPLNNFVTDLRNSTNNLAGKKDTADRSLEYATNRHIYSTMTNLSNRVSANMVGGSISSALTNFIPITQSWGEVNPVNSLKAMRETIKSYILDDGMVDKSDFMTNRLRTTENLYQTNWDKISDGVSILMDGIDNFTTQVVWRSKHMENMENGMSEDEAIKNADQFAENIMAGRSRGNMPTIFNSKNPITKVFTAFQLEVNNQYGYMFKDMPQDMRNETKGKLIKGYATMFIGAYVYNALYSTLTGRDAAFDPIGIIEQLLRNLGAFDEEEEKEPLEVLYNLGENITEEIPFIGGLLGGGRIPISSALPYDGPKEAITGTLEDISNKNWKNLTWEWLNPVFYLGMPVGGGQTRKTIQGLSMFDDDLPISGSYTNSGKLRFPVEETPLNVTQAAVFGQYASENARDYFDNNRSPLSDKQLEEFLESKLPIKEYWDYREGLKGKKKLQEKADYIAGLDIPISAKNVLINNHNTREEKIDLTDYDLFETFEEFDFATKNPEKYAISKAVGGYKAYTEYTKTINGITGNTDSSGNKISGSRKQKVLNYIKGLEISQAEKMILFRQEYTSDNRYNGEIIDYLSGRNDISYQDKIAILKELGFTVDKDGTVRW